MAGQSAADLVRRADELEAQKYNWSNLAQVCAKYCIPSKAKITEIREEGSRVHSEIYNSTPIEAAQIAAAGLQSFLASGKYFALEFENPELNDDNEAYDWLQEEQEGIYDVMNNSNFDSKIGEVFRDLVVLPGATMYSEPDPDSIIHFETIPFQEVLIAVNSRGIVDELHRVFEYTVKQAYDRWGENCGPQISELYRKGKLSEKFQFQHSVAKRYERTIGKRDSKNMPYYSCYVLRGKKKKIEEKGYIDFPYVVGRWSTITGETWAYTPASIGIADILMLNNMDMTVLMAGQQATSPAWLFPDENFVAPLNMNPFAINYRIPNPAGKTASEKDPIPLVSTSNMQIGLELLQAREERIKRFFFVDLFLPLLEKQATAYEVAKTIEKKMGILGAVIGGITKNVLGPSINRARLIRRQHPSLQGKLSPIPDIIKDGERVKTNYISPLVLAQKASQQQNTEAFLYSVAQMMQVNPQVRHKIKWDVAIDKDAKNRAIDMDILTTEAEYQELVQAENQAQADANALAMTQAAGTAMKNVGEGGKALMPEQKKESKKK